MDPIAHTLFGAAAAQTGLGRRSAYATAALVIGANLPDIDGAAMFLGGDSALYWRRGWTHGILALVLLPLLLTAILIAWSRAFGRPPPRPRVLLGLCYLAVWSHPSLDWLNTYGLRWLMPFDGTWFYGDTLYVVDPWFWLILAGAAFLFRSRRVWSLVAWTLFAAFFAYLLFGANPNLRARPHPWLDDRERTALHHAAFHNSDEMLRALIAAGADVEATDGDGMPPLGVAAQQGHVNAIRTLVAEGARARRVPREHREKLREIAERWRIDELLE